MDPFSSRLVFSIFLSVAIVASSVAAEKNPRSDIPDNQIFVKYASAAGGYRLEVPEAWARIENGADVSLVISSINAGGLALSRYSASAVLCAAIVICILLVPQRAAAKSH